MRREAGKVNFYINCTAIKRAMICHHIIAQLLNLFFSGLKSFDIHHLVPYTLLVQNLDVRVSGKKLFKLHDLDMHAP